MLEQESVRSPRVQGDPPLWVQWLGMFLRDVGFPAFIALYVLLVQTPVLMELRDAVRELIVITNKGAKP